MTRHLPKGFSLIELLIVIAIIGILAAIGYPSYMNSVREGNRTDAISALNNAAQLLQRCYTTLNTYADTTNCTVRASLESTDGLLSNEQMYSVKVAANGGGAATTYLLTATAIATPQTADTGCTEMTLSHTGVRAPAACW